jgi:pantetheine-phosphate adenylyltransferase
MNITAIYPGTFDPITNGHTDLVSRATRLFDRVIIAVAENTSKKPVFSVDERVAMARTVIGKMENVEVCSFRGLVTAFARQREARVIIRGLRAVSDFEYEFQMAGMNRQLNDQTETVFLMPSEHLSYISSSLVREVASLGGDVSKFVHREVMEALRNRLVPQ